MENTHDIGASLNITSNSGLSEIIHNDPDKSPVVQIVDRAEALKRIKNCARPSTINPGAELASRILARRHLFDYTTYTFPSYKPDLMHILICDALMMVVEEQINKLFIFSPPQFGKSELVSRRFPVFWMAKRLDDPIILTSYAEKLAASMVSDTRDIIESEFHKALFPEVMPSSSSRGKANYDLENSRGGIISAGVGGPITGFGAGLGLIDDPLKNYEEAFSENRRRMIYNWYRNVFRTRVWSHGAQVMVMTRWHEEDIAGTLLEKQGNKWATLRITAKAESQDERDEKNGRLFLQSGVPDPLLRQEGESAAPSRYDKASIRELEEDVGPYTWSSQYMACPTTPEGFLFKRDWFESNVYVDTSPVDAMRVWYWDKAGTEDGGTYTVGILMCYDGTKYYIEDMVWGKWAAPERESKILASAEHARTKYSYKYQATIWVEQEPGSGGKESAEATVRNLSGFIVKADKVRGKKHIRWQILITQLSNGNVKIVRGSWNWFLIDKLVNTMVGGKDLDFADAASGALAKLAPRVRAKIRSLMGVD